MRILKRVLLAILLLIVIALVVALFVPKALNVNKEIVINKPKQEVFNYIKQLKNQPKYSVWSKMDPTMLQTYTGVDGTVGFVTSWDGNKDVGKGSQTITRIVEGDSFNTQLHFIKPWESKADALMTTKAINDSTTKVNWGFKSSMSYPMNLMRLFMNMEKMLGDDYTKGLANLKVELEK
jgi:Polyketide cyclase / dehydrase and lipid transport